MAHEFAMIGSERSSSRLHHVTVPAMANPKHLSILTAILFSASIVACGGSKTEAESPADESADEDAVNDEMMDLAEDDMPDDGFEEGGMDEGMEGDEAPADEMPE